MLASDLTNRCLLKSNVPVGKGWLETGRVRTLAVDSPDI